MEYNLTAKELNTLQYALSIANDVAEEYEDVQEQIQALYTKLSDGKTLDI